jgi:Holliday junction resolvasome RuvABC endonuclease subunit
MGKKEKPVLNRYTEELATVVCIDQSYTHAGFSVWDLNTATLLNFTQFGYEKTWTNKDKRIAQGAAALSLASMFECNAVIVEEPRMFPSAQTKARLHEIVATVSNMVELPVYMVNTTTWKAATVGHRASKAETVQYVLEHFNVTADDDVADAICIGEAVGKGVKIKRFF